jgi:putative endonuclease
MSKTSSGQLGEQIAADFLTKAGYKIIDRNFRSRSGEIDIITIKDESVVYIEVKARWGREFGLPEEAITSRKIESIRTTAAYYRIKKQNLPFGERIDVVVIEINSNNQVERIELIENVGQF